MSQQLLLTNFFKAGKNTNSPAMDKTRRSLSLKKPLTPNKRKLDIKTDEGNSDDDLIVIEDDIENLVCTPDQNITQSPHSSSSSNKTVVYSPETPRLKVASPFKVNNFSPTAKSQTPSKKGKFFSPSKKKSVRTPKKSPLHNKSLDTNRRLFENREDYQYRIACEGLDDKTKFLLNTIHSYLKDDSLKKLMDERSNTLLKDYYAIHKLGMRLICRLYWRKEGWYKKDDIKKIISEEDKEIIDDPTTFTILNELVNKQFLLIGSEQNMSFIEFTKVLKADEIKDICKELKMKTQTKKSAVNSLEEYCRKTPISTYFSKNINAETNETRVLNIMSKKVGPCYCLSDLARSTLERLYMLSYLSLSYDVIREKRLELMLINDKIKRETYPIVDCELDNASVVFESKEEFDRYLFAHCIQEDYINRTNPMERCRIVEQVYRLYNDLDPEHIVRYASLPKWLQRYTPVSIYVKLLENGVQDLKREKSEGSLKLAVDILTSLLGQTFRRHKMAGWLAEKALVEQVYLSMPTEAAQTLIEGFESDLSETWKDTLRPRAKKIAQQKNLQLPDDIRRKLLNYATKDTIEESSLPSRHIHKQPMENITKGKAMYETKADSSRIIQGVEDFALSAYTADGEYTHGGHWEGRIVKTIFFLLFWDIIYSKPRQAKGVFLNPLQLYPLDIYGEEFYENRKEAIDKRLKEISQCTEDELALMITREWDRRPEHELSGITRDIGLDNVLGVCVAAGASGVGALCARAAGCGSASGFPDLTLWNERTKQIMFSEVKSDNDKPCMKQIQWMKYLLDSGLPAEFCYVGAHTSRNKARNSSTL